MKIDLDKDHMDVGGKPTGQKVATFAVMALMTAKPNSGPPEREMAYKLAVRVRETPKDIDLSIEEMAFVKDWCGWLLNPLDFGQIAECLEGR